MTIRGRLLFAVVAVAVALMLITTPHAQIVKMESDWSHDIKLATFCIEGHVFVVAISDVGKGGGTAIVQIQHDLDGKIVPMKCAGQTGGKNKDKGGDRKK